MRSINGFDFLGLLSAEGDGGADDAIWVSGILRAAVVVVRWKWETICFGRTIII